MPATCAGSIKVCRMRATRLTASGAPLEGVTSVYVTEQIVEMGMTPEVTEGDEKEVLNGCECLALSYRSPDRTKRYTFELKNALLEPALIEMMAGLTIIPGVGVGSVIGNVLADDTASCVGTPNGVAIEMWSEAWSGGGPLAGFSHIHWIFPRTIWRVGEWTLNGDFLEVSMTGYSIPNGLFGDPYDDQPAGMPAYTQGAYFFTAEDMPDAACAYAALDLTP